MKHESAVHGRLALMAAAAILVSGPGRDLAAQDDGGGMPGYPRELGRPTGQLLQELRTVPEDIPWEIWLGTAKRLGVSLLERPEDRSGPNDGGVMVEGFRFQPNDYPALEGFVAVRADVVTAGEGFVNQISVLRRGDGPVVRVFTEVGQSTATAARHAFLYHILRPNTSGGSYPPPASDIGLSVGDAATAGDAPIGETRYVNLVCFYRRTVMVGLIQEGQAVDLGALAKAIDAKVLERPRVSTLAASKLRPRITRFSMAGGSAKAGETVEGEADWEDPQGGTLVADVEAQTGDASLTGTRISYQGLTPGMDKISLFVANSLNLSDQKDVTILVR